MHAAIASCTARTPEREHVQTFIDRCYQMAVVYLRRRARAGRLDTAFFGRSLEDLAMDCIADLFERDDAGRFPRLVAYFEPMMRKNLSQARLIGATRRLVFSKVSDGLFRRYREADPALGKLIRNLRYAVRRCADVHEERVRGHLWVVCSTPADCSRPLMGDELLQVRLSTLVGPAVGLKDAVKCLRRVLLANPVYAPGYPLVGLACVLRAMFDLRADQLEPSRPSFSSLHLEDIRRILDYSRIRIDREMRRKYVDAKVDAPTFDAYLRAAEDGLLSEFVELGAGDATHFDLLKPYLTCMTYDDFRHDHRGRFQYVLKKLRDDFLTSARRDW